MLNGYWLREYHPLLHTYQFSQDVQDDLSLLTLIQDAKVIQRLPSMVITM